jgi:hypothetical protein
MAAIAQAVDDGLLMQQYIDPKSLPDNFIADSLDLLLRASAALASNDRLSNAVGPAR